MPATKGHLLPVYILVDESASMANFAEELNHGLVSLHETIRSEPMIGAKVRLSILGFSDNVEARLELTDVRNVESIPRLKIRSSTNYQAVFEELLNRIPHDVNTLKTSGYLVHRPVVFFLSDGLPSRSNWMEPHDRLTNKITTPAAPNIIACGVGDALAETILRVATQPEFAFITRPGTDIGAAIHHFFTALTASVVRSGRSLNSSNPELVVERPEGFRLAIDLV